MNQINYKPQLLVNNTIRVHIKKLEDMRYKATSILKDLKAQITNRKIPIVYKTNPQP